MQYYFVTHSETLMSLFLWVTVFFDLSCACFYSLNIFTKYFFDYFGYCNLRMFKIVKNYRYLYLTLPYFQKLLIDPEIS